MFVGLLILLCLALTFNAVSAATVNQSTAANSTYTINSTQKTTTTTASNSTKYAAGSAAGSSTVIKVLIYSGTGASTNCVNGLKTALSSANTNNLVSGVTFSYSTATTLTSTLLSAYNVLIMPGGSGGSVYLNYISKSVIQNFVKNGGAYIGICAGAYAAAAHTNKYYDGWGIAPHVYCNPVSYEGTTTMTITSAGATVLNRSGTITLAHYNGPAMYLASSGAVIFGTYADSKTGYKGYADIVGDYYGNGRTVLIGSHPELSPQYPDIIANLIIWATNTSTNNNPSTTLTLKQIASASYSIKAFTDKYNRLPNYVTIGSDKYSMSKFLYLASKATIQISNGSTSSITSINVNSASGSTGTYTSGNITKSEFVTMANKIVSFINSYGRAPNYVTCSLGKISYNSVIYMFAKIMNFYNSYARLPNYVSM